MNIAVPKTRANDRQVGGDHYKTGGSEHWDLFGAEYLIGCGTKYVARWRKKGGAVDLEKAKHYSQKLLEVMSRGSTQTAPPLNVEPSFIDVWAPNQEIGWVEITIIKRLMFFRCLDDIREAISGIDFLIEKARDPGVDQFYCKRGDGGGYIGLKREIPSPKTRGVMTETILDQQRKESLLDDGAQHASLYPWQMSREKYLSLEQSRRALLDEFYTQRGNRMVLDPYVKKVQHLPRELGACYAWVTNTGGEHGYWLLMMDRVPEDARENYAHLSLELNMKEHSEIPSWQRGLYARADSEDGKFRLLDKNLAWG